MPTIEELMSCRERLHERGLCADDWPDEAVAEVLRLEDIEIRYANIKPVWDHALECVDRVFQRHQGNPNPILPDFCGWGRDKFEAVIRLAEEYRALTEAGDWADHIRRAAEQIGNLTEQAAELGIHREASD